MNTAAAIDRMRDAGVELWLEGDALRYRAPPDVLTPERLDWLRAHREDLAEALRLTPDADPALELYAALFEGQAARALVSLEPADVRRAVALELVTAEVAATSVLLAYRRPGVAGALLAVPREKYDGLAVLAAFAKEGEL